jgi:osmotically-inducible protein OsmY
MAAAHFMRPAVSRIAGEKPVSPFNQQQEIETQGHALLRQAPYMELRHVTCEFHEGILTLRGSVSSFYMKQLAQTVVRSLDGVERLLNRVEVVRSPQWR